MKEFLDSFQLTTSQGGRRAWTGNVFCGYYFNSRPHKEVDTDAPKKLPSTNAFQLTTSQGGRRFLQCGFNCVYKYFNSRPHKEVDFYKCCCKLIIIISTHDLTRRSTLIIRFLFCNGSISTHDLTRRSTLVL